MINNIVAGLEPAIAWLTQRSPWFAAFINRLVINGVVSSTRSRPHPWSTKTPYISWAALSDKTYSARFLPEAVLDKLPSKEDATALFSRQQGPQELCRKSTALFPAFAQYLTDGFIRTLVHNDDTLSDRRRTTTNHEIDLCPLYGRNPEQTQALRLKDSTAGRLGRMKSQLIDLEEFPPFLYAADGTLLPEFKALDEPLGSTKLPSAVQQTLFAVGGDRANASVGVAMINTLFLREHNRLAGMIEARHPGWDDDRVFETARNIVIVMFIKIVVEEYINHISPSRIAFLADPSSAWRYTWNKPNWITAEFSLLYRWHSLVPDTIDWGGSPQQMSTFAFGNSILIKAGLTDAFIRMSAQPAARLGVGNTAPFLAPVEQHAIQQARDLNIASYNDYRRAMGLKPAQSWSDVSSDAETQQRLEAAYPAGVDSLEFYIGLFAEDPVPNSPLPELILRMVAIDAFSQALTNPLLSENIWGNETNRLAAFTEAGFAEIEKTKSLRDIMVRNGADPKSAFVGMTRPNWKRDWKIQKAA